MRTIAELSDGLQHIGVPARDLQESIAFYESLGFTLLWSDNKQPETVAFLKLGSCVIETYSSDTTAGQAEAIDHIALNVSDIEAAFAAIKAGGFRMIDNEINFLPFFKQGVRFFTILGPNEEKVEFNQIL